MKKIFMAFVAMCCFYFAQGQINYVALDINPIPNNDTNAGIDTAGVPIPYNTALLIVERIQSLSPANTIVKLHVKLGTSAGASDLKSKVFDLSLPGLYDDKTSLAVTDTKLYVVLGSFDHQGTFYTEVKAEMSDGSFSEVYGDSAP